MIISIDGPAGSGKSTVAELVSKKLNFIHFNSGSLYRGITAFLLDENIEIAPTSTIPKIILDTKFIDGIQHVFVNGKDYTFKLRDNLVSINSPAVSTNPKTRKIVDECQRKFANANNVVIDGRDIGSFVFPDADFKFYLDCDLIERAKRRFKEEKLKNKKITLKEIKQQIALRDEIDKNKPLAPLVVPKGAVVVDTTHLTIDEVVAKILSFIEY